MTDTKNPFHIYFGIPTELEQEYFEDCLKELANDSLILKGERTTPKPWASFEWAVPGLILAYIAKPYFEAFLKEAGKDHYIKLSGWLKKLLTKGKSIEVTTISSGPLKLDKTNTQSKAISIYFQSKSEREIKLLFDNDLSLDDWTNALESFMNLITEHYEKYPHDTLTRELSNLSDKPYYTIYAIISKETKQWKFYDDRILMLMRHASGES